MSLHKNLRNMSRDQKASIVHELHTHNVNIDSREVFVHGYIGDLDEDPGVEWRIANNFLKNLRLLEGLSNDKLIVVHQYSPGGSWSAGIMMYDAILHCEAPVLYVMWGEACSMGSIIPQAADKRVMSPSCSFMIHDGCTSINNSTYKQAQSQIVFEKRMKQQMMDIYSAVCVNGEFFCEEYSESDVQNFIEEKLEKKEDWYMTAEEAVEYGFADGVLGNPGFETILDIKKNWENESE